MIENNRNNEQIYGRNDMIMLDPNNKIYGSLGIADRYVMKTEEGTRLILSNPKLGNFGDVLTEFNIYGRSEQKHYKGINLFPPDTNSLGYVEVSIPKGSFVFWATDGTPAIGGNFRFVNENKTEEMWFSVEKGETSKIVSLTIDVKYVQNVIKKDFDLSKICLGIGNKPIYEPYTGGIPSPSSDYPQEIKSVVNPIVKVTNEDGTQFETVTIPYTLNAIPVASGGNVTIDGQQYIADRVVEKDGVFGIERNTAIDVPVLTKTLRETPDTKGRFIQDYAFKKTFTPSYAPLVNIGYSRIWGITGSVIDKWIFGVNKMNFYISPPKDLNYTSEDILNALKDLDIKVYGALVVPFFEPFTGDIQAKLRDLVTYYPVTIVENNYNTWMKATYKSTESV